MRALGVLLVIVPTIAYSPQLARTQPGSKACSACPTRCAAPVANAVNKGLRLRQLENNLKVAISNEDYDTAAKLRDILAVLKMDTEAGAIAANDEFYRCFSKRNLACMERLWLNDESSVVACVHPGHAPLFGISRVMESWSQIFATTEVKVSAADVRCRVRNGVARVTCTERLGGGKLIATNVFEEHDGQWRMVLHQAAPLLVEAEQPEAEPDEAVPDEDPDDEPRPPASAEYPAPRPPPASDYPGPRSDYPGPRPPPASGWKPPGAEWMSPGAGWEVPPDEWRSGWISPEDAGWVSPDADWPPPDVQWQAPGDATPWDMGGWE